MTYNGTSNVTPHDRQDRAHAEAENNFGSFPLQTLIFSGPAGDEAEARKALGDAGFDVLDGEPQTAYSNLRGPDEAFIAARSQLVEAAIAVIEPVPGWGFRGGYSLPNEIVFS